MNNYVTLLQLTSVAAALYCVCILKMVYIQMQLFSFSQYFPVYLQLCDSREQNQNESRH